MAKKSKPVIAETTKTCWCDNVSAEGIAITVMAICGLGIFACLMAGIWSGNEWWFKPGITFVATIGMTIACWGFYEEVIK